MFEKLKNAETMERERKIIRRKIRKIKEMWEGKISKSLAVLRFSFVCKKILKTIQSIPPG